MKSALRHLAWTFPVLALLAGCNGGESAKPEPHAVATYAPRHLERPARSQ